MKIAGWLTEKVIGGCLVLMLAAPSAKAAVMPRQDEATAPVAQSKPQSGTQNVGVDSGSGSGKPTVDAAQPDASIPDAPEVALLQNPPSNRQNSSSQPSQDPQQNDATPTEPVGTAAAPGVTRTGVTASKPAGAAIAPAKQRRVRTILISLVVVAAAGVAIGTVAGISRTSPSQPK
jgi:hypothetical protein